MMNGQGTPQFNQVPTPYNTTQQPYNIAHAQYNTTQP
jgi:hypothetical protein